MTNKKGLFNLFGLAKKKEIQLVRIFFLQVIVAVSIMLIVVLLLWIKREKNTLERETVKLQQDYLNTQKENIKKETERAVNYINYQISQTDTAIRLKLKKRVEMAHNIATSIYHKNKNSSSIESIKSQIKEALRPIRFDDGRGYFFIGSLSGYEILYPVRPEFEGKYVYNLQDDLGSYVMQDELSVVTTKGEGFVTNYWTRPGLDSSMAFKKISYVKLLKPLDWYIGTGDYYADFTQEIQQEIINWLSSYRFGNEGYIFVNTYDGDAIISNGKKVVKKKNLWNLEDPNGVKVIQEERRAVKNPEGDFIYYSWKKLTSDEISQKISFVKGVPEWKWMVGAGVYLEEINEVLLAKKEALRASIKKDVLLITIWLSTLLLFIYILTLFLSRKTKTTIDSFIQFFKKASHENVLIDESKINFSEFKIIGRSINQVITEIKESKLQNQEKEARYEKLFEESPEAIAFLDKDGVIQRINSAFTKLFGFNNNECVLKKLDELIVPKELRTEASIYSSNFKDGYSKQIEAIRLTKDMAKVFVSIIGTPILVNENLIGYYVIYRNITEQKTFEQQLYESKIKAEESDRLKTSFLTNLSHEIRTPLNAIIGFSTLLNTKEVSREDQKEYLRLLGNSGKLLLEIIDNIIDISKIESANLSVNKTNSNINTMLDELLIDFKEHKDNIKLDSIDLTLHKAIQDKELYIYTDIKRLKQIFTNLLDNALKFTSKGKVEFGYKLNENEVLCFVKDTGIGIKDDEVEFIFDRFRQADESTTRKYGGTGVGLALTKSLVELLGGKIWVESKTGQGAKFYFTIPYEVSKKKKTTAPQNNQYKKTNWKDKTILVAEDVEANYKLLHSYLAYTKATIKWAKNGQEALQIIENNPHINLILMDINMPVMNGHEALQEILSRGYNVPVIAQTAYATEEQHDEILNLGYSDYILKPITLGLLMQKISKFLN